jgi:hypothetical protein
MDDVLRNFPLKKNNSPYAKRPEGSRKSGLDFAQTFGTVRNIKK